MKEERETLAKQGPDELDAKARSCVRLPELRIQKSMGQLENPSRLRRDPPRPRADQDLPAGARARGEEVMEQATKEAGTEPWRGRQTKVGRVVSDKMQKRIVVAVERHVQEGRYQRTIKRTSRFMAHDEKGEREGRRQRRASTRRGRSAAEALKSLDALREAMTVRPSADGRRGSAMIQMRSILDVADNSGARKIAVIPIGGSTGPLRAPRRHRHGVGEGSDAGSPRQEGSRSSRPSSSGRAGSSAAATAPTSGSTTTPRC